MSETMTNWGVHDLFKAIPIQFSDLGAFFLLIQMLVILTSKPPILENQAETIK